MEIAYDLSIAQKNATSNHCEKCDITFKSKKKSRRHMIKEHIDSSNDQEATTGNYCEKCDITFKSKKRLRRHLIKDHETIGKPACERCDEIFNIFTWLENSLE